MKCPECGVWIVAHMDRCWSCGCELPDDPEKNFDDDATRKVIDFIARDIETQVECEGEEGV